MEQIRIVLIDDQVVMRKGLRTLIEAEKGLTVVAEANDSRSALTAVQTHTPNLVITDVNLPELTDAAAVTRRISQNHPPVNVLVLSDNITWKSVKEMLEAGAKGYLSKKCDTSELLSSIRRVADGRVCLDEAISFLMVSNCLQPNATDTVRERSETLTHREKEILAMMADGKSAKQIAFDLGLNIRTVAQHRQNIMNKLNLYSIADLTKYAIKEGLAAL